MYQYLIADLIPGGCKVGGCGSGFVVKFCAMDLGEVD